MDFECAQTVSTSDPFTGRLCIRVYSRFGVITVSSHSIPWELVWGNAIEWAYSGLLLRLISLFGAKDTPP